MRYLIINILFLGVVVTGFGQQELSLENAIKTSLQENYDVVISENQVSQAMINNTPGAAGLIPNISANATGVARYDDNNQGEFSTTSVLPGIQLTYRVFGGGAAWINKERLDLLQEFSEGNAELVIENTIQAVTLAYNQVIVERERLKVFQEVLELSRDRYQYELNREELGLAVSFDVLQARNAYLSDSSNLLLQELNYKNAHRNLNLLMNKPLESRHELVDELTLPEARMDRNAIMQELKSDNASLRTQMLNLSLSKQQVKLQRTALFPSLDLRAGTDYGWSRVKFASQPEVSGSAFDYYANFTLSFTLFNGGNVRRLIRDAEIDQEIANLELSALELNLENQALAFLDLNQVQYSQLELARENLEAAELNLQIAEEKFRSGAINSFNYRDIQLIYLNAALSLIGTRYALAESYTQLMRLSGRLMPAN